MAINNTLISTGAGTDIYVTPGVSPTDEREYAVTCVIFCNYSNDDVSLMLHVIPRGLTPLPDNKIIHNLLIPAGETFSFDTEKIVLNTGDYIRAIANATGRLSATVSSMRIS
jgi:hypothetical protein